MHARSENLHDGARSAPEICAIFMNRRANSSYFHEADDDGIIMARSRIGMLDLATLSRSNSAKLMIQDARHL